MQKASDPSRRNVPGRRRVLLGQLISFGDCLYATTAARQIKHDDPDCHLTWAVSERCRSLLEGNPHVDAVWEWPAFANDDLEAAWVQFHRQALARQAAGEFDDVYLTQFVAGNTARWDGNLRAAILAGYPSPITVPVAPVVRLTAREIDNVRRFAEQHGLTKKTGDEPLTDSPVILFECAPGSNQSFVTPAYALEVSRLLFVRQPDLKVILSSHLSADGDGDPRILPGHLLTFRENAELTRYCSLLIGCSSGLTWLGTSEAARRLPTVQLLTNHVPNCNSPVADHRRWNLPVHDIIEMFDCPAGQVAECMDTIWQTGFAAARQRFHREPVNHYGVYRVASHYLLTQRNYRDAARLCWRNRSLLLHPTMWLWHLMLPVRRLLHIVRGGRLRESAKAPLTR